MTTCAAHRSAPMRMCSLCGWSYRDDSDHEHTPQVCVDILTERLAKAHQQEKDLTEKLDRAIRICKIMLA